MVVKILNVEDSKGNPVEGQVCLMNKSGSFSRLCKSNMYIENLIKHYGTPVYVNITIDDKDINVKGVVRASF